jgi:hypothetical protein
VSEVDRSENARRALLKKRPAKKQTPGDRWATRILKKYGLTPDDVALKWAEQNGECPICGVDLTTKRWVIDHDHKTDVFRGILDAWCNHRIVSMAERGGWARAYCVLWYLWPDKIAQRSGL